MRTKSHNMPLKRKRQGRTNYNKRLKMLLSNKLRLVIRKSLNNLMAQVIEYKSGGDNVLLCSHSAELKRFGWTINKGNIPSAYLTGYLLGIKAKKKGITNLILDLGMQKKGQRIFAALKGAVDAGLNIPFSEEIIPDENRIKGQHISQYAAASKEKEKIFGVYLKNKIDPSQLPKLFEEVKNKIKGAENNA
jgi:large subunit ribosomal protein L18